MAQYKEKHLLEQHLILHPDRAIFWKEKKSLIVADPHFGKGQVFREGGIPIPSGTTRDDFARLTLLIERFEPTILVILGDLIHDQLNNSTRLNLQIDQWRRRHRNVQLYLTTGNHDVRSGAPPAQFRFDRVATEIYVPPFVFSHQPKSDSSLYGIAGHLHPAVTISGKARLKETLPCFYFGPRSVIMPAFGSFTGIYAIRPTSDDQIYVIAGDQVIEMRNQAP
jgi:DNA ligase-associated metallophosphoesterase